MSSRTYLTTSFKEKDRVKALGAKWDREAGQWYVPPGLDLAPFAIWLPAGPLEDVTDLVAPVNADASSGALETQLRGVSLSQLLSGVATVVTRAFSDGIWTTAEVVRAAVNKGHYYLELSERDETGSLVAQARAIIWARNAQSLLAEFRRATGADLDAGIKVLVRAKPVFSAQYGFSLEIDGIDPSYTLGDLEAKKRGIRERLRDEGLYDRNRLLSAPWDFNAVLVVAPERAAGLGDFAKEATRLESYGVCQFIYSYSRFQGEGAAAEIAEAIDRGLRSWAESTLPDAVVIIRGGGSVNDLAWLNDYDLARRVCECPVPVFAGIGHERDDTSIDEVAHRSFDTPSKVISGIEEAVRTRAREARASFDSIVSKTQGNVAVAATRARDFSQYVERAAKSTIDQARAATDSAASAVHFRSLTTVHDADRQTRQSFDSICADSKSQLALARREAPAALARIGTLASSSVVEARQLSVAGLCLLLERGAAQHRTASQLVDAAMRDTVDGATRSVNLASDRSKALFREVIGQGPHKTLNRGFAIVRSEGRTVTAAGKISSGTQIEVTLHDGVVGATVSNIRKTTDGDAHGS